MIQIIQIIQSADKSKALVIATLIADSYDSRYILNISADNYTSEEMQQSIMYNICQNQTKFVAMEATSLTDTLLKALSIFTVLVICIVTVNPVRKALKNKYDITLISIT